MVIDTDGSAFITKAEFDSLKNNFQSQIDSYNSAIDSKIDGAIAAYLAGVQVSSTTYVDSLYDKYTISGLLDSSGNPSKLYWSGSSTYRWQTASSILVSEHNVLSSNDFSLSSGDVGTTYHGVFDWSHDRPSVLERYNKTSIGGTNKSVVTNVQNINQLFFFYTVCIRKRQKPNQFGHANDYGSTYGFLTSKSEARKGKTRTIGHGPGADNQYKWQIESIDTLTETFGNYTQGGSTGQGTHSYTTYAVAPLSLSNYTYGYDDTVDTLVFYEGSQKSLNDASTHNLSYSNLKNDESGVTKPASVEWADCTWPWGVQWKCDGKSYPGNIIYQDFYNVDNRNREIKCGLVLCNAGYKGKYTVTCTPQLAGKVILYKSATALADNGAANGTKQEYNVAAGTENSLIFDVDSPNTNDAIWILYLPTSGIGYIDINAITAEISNE